MKKSSRNLSLDLLRVLIMFMIVIWHSIVHGGVLEKIPLFSISYFGVYTLMAFLIVHVNCFVLLSGYFLSTKKFRLSRVLELWIQIFFWSVILYFITTMIQGNPIEVKELVKSLMPFTQQRYWFMTTYLLMYLLLPFLNITIKAMTKQQHKMCLLVYFMVFICLQNIIMWREFTSVNERDPLFFCFLYMIGAYMKKYPIKSRVPWLLIYIICSLINVASRFILTWITNPIFGETIDGIFNSYISITSVIGAVSLFMTFASLKPNRIRVSKAISKSCLLLAP